MPGLRRWDPLPERGEFRDGGGGEAADYGGWEAKGANEFRKGGRLGGTTVSACSLDGLVVQVFIHGSGVGERV